jgi:hypothetical protein
MSLKLKDSFTNPQLSNLREGVMYNSRTLMEQIADILTSIHKITPQMITAYMSGLSTERVYAEKDGRDLDVALIDAVFNILEETEKLIRSDSARDQ